MLRRRASTQSWTRGAAMLPGQRLDLNRVDSTFMNHRGVLFASDRELGQALLAVLVERSDGD